MSNDQAIIDRARALETGRDAVIATDVGGAIVYWNDAAEDLYGWRSDEVIGRNVVDVMWEDSIAIVRGDPLKPVTADVQRKIDKNIREEIIHYASQPKEVITRRAVGCRNLPCPIT